MTDGFSIKLQGFDELMAVLKKAPSTLNDEVVANIKDAAFAIQGDAKSRAPTNHSILKNSIAVEPATNNGLTVAVVAKAAYSPFVEFGTGTHVDVPDGVEEYALQFKGEHEIPGMHAQPFLFPAVAAQTPKILADIQRSIQKSLTPV